MLAPPDVRVPNPARSIGKKMTRAAIIPVERIEQTIVVLRGPRVILDADLAVLYAVSTKALNQAVKRNLARFPDEFMFRLSTAEKWEVVTNCDHLARLRFSPTMPRAFTEHGVLMAATVLNSQRAIAVSVAIIRAFVRLRAILMSNAELSRRLANLERKYDAQFKVVFDAIRQLMTPPTDSPKPRIGFHTEHQHRHTKEKR